MITSMNAYHEISGIGDQHCLDIPNVPQAMSPLELQSHSKIRNLRFPESDLHPHVRRVLSLAFIPINDRCYCETRYRRWK